MNSYLSSTMAAERHVELVRKAEQARILREADVPTTVDSVRLIVGRSVVRLGGLIAGRRLWTQSPTAEPVSGVRAANSALTLAR